MEREILENYLNGGLSTNDIVKITNKSQTTIVYWMKKHGLKSNFINFKDQGVKDYGEYRFCPRCKKECKTSDFYNRRGKANSSVYCKSCTSDQTLERMRALKLQMVEYKGGSCVKCGYNRYLGALEFHHLNPDEKDFNPSQLKRYKFDDNVKSELDKCILVCSNCHRETHDEINRNKKETQS